MEELCVFFRTSSHSTVGQWDCSRSSRVSLHSSDWLWDCDWAGVRDWDWGSGKNGGWGLTSTRQSRLMCRGLFSAFRYLCISNDSISCPLVTKDALCRSAMPAASGRPLSRYVSLFFQSDRAVRSSLPYMLLHWNSCYHFEAARMFIKMCTGISLGDDPVIHVQ